MEPAPYPIKQTDFRLDQLLQQSKKELSHVSTQAYQESLWILADVLNLSLSEVYLEKKSISFKQQKLFWNKIQRRKKAEPLEYILKEKTFFKRNFYIEKGVFIPRKESETLVLWILDHFFEKKIKAVEFGAGSGALCLSLLSERPFSQFLSLEINPIACRCLKKNRKTFNMEKKLILLEKDVSQITKKEVIQILGSVPSLIVANPPYIDPQDVNISQDVYLYDSPLALFSDQGGMGHIYSWFKKAMECLDSKGIYIFEFGWNQEQKVKDFCKNQTELSSYIIEKDEAGRARIAICFKK